jgi:LmbE family N-acetylglucosaminyl deacetylase
MASKYTLRKTLCSVQHWIYLSPHFDDVALSCGGLVWEQAQAGKRVSVWTVCGGEIPAGALSPFAELLHARWQTGREAVEQRRLEDIASCQAMQASCRHFPLPDCIYRRPGEDYWAEPQSATAEHLYASEEAIFGAVDPAERPLIEQFSARLREALPAGAEVVCPLALGGHVDHRLTRLAAEKLGRRLWYYADYPYVLRQMEDPRRLEEAGWQKLATPVSAAGLKAWQAAIAAHESQISTFWADLREMEAEMARYAEVMRGGTVFRAGRNAVCGTPG